MSETNKWGFDPRYLESLFSYIDEMVAGGIDEEAWVAWFQEDYGLTRLTAQEVIAEWKALR